MHFLILALIDLSQPGNLFIWLAKVILSFEVLQQLFGACN
jgi:hypothetical protein